MCNSDAHNRRSGRSSKWIRPERRLAIYIRDGFRCLLCGELTTRGDRCLDHVIPRLRGGPHTTDNLVTAHISCNNRRQDGPVPLAAVERVRQALRTPITPHTRQIVRDLKVAADLGYTITIDGHTLALADLQLDSNAVIV